MLEINSTPTSFVECLKISNVEVDMEHVQENGELKWYSDYVFTIVGDCEQSTKELIAKEIERLENTKVGANQRIQQFLEPLVWHLLVRLHL